MLFSPFFPSLGQDLCRHPSRITRVHLKEDAVPVVKNVLIRTLEWMIRKPVLTPEQIDFSTVRTVLVIRQHDQLGDFLLATPVFRAIRNRFPEAYVGVLVRDYFADAVAGNPLVDEILVLQKGSRCWDPRRIMTLWQKVYKRWDLTIVLNTVSHSLSSDLLAELSSKKLILGSAHRVFPGASRNFFYNLVAPYSLTTQHQSERNLDIVRYINAHTEDLSEFMYVGDTERHQALESLHQLGMCEGKLSIALHIGAGKKANRWPVARFARLAQLLHDRLGAQIVLFWGPDEATLADEFCRLITFVPVKVHPAGLRYLAACFTQCSLLVCNDTGVMHVCASVGVPLVAAFGPTPPEEWKPIGDTFVAVRTTTCSVGDVEVDSVYRQVITLLQRTRPEADQETHLSSGRGRSRI
jgi:ADP-heptose:LPS heptosyltransferase